MRAGAGVALVVSVNCFLPKFCAAFGRYLPLGSTGIHWAGLDPHPMLILISKEMGFDVRTRSCLAFNGQFLCPKLEECPSRMG